MVINPELDDDWDWEFFQPEMENLNVGFDTKKYLCWFQDPNYKPARLFSKSEIAKFYDVSLKTVDSWIQRGAPVWEKGSNGINYKIAGGPFREWWVCYQNGISIDEYRQSELETAKRAEEHWKARKLERDNKQLTAELAQLRSEFTALQREVRASKRK